MQPQSHPLESFFQQAVRNSYEGKLGLNDPDVTSYVAHLLCEFSRSEKLYKMRDEMGRPIAELEPMVTAADPINGTAPSFDAERMVRKYIGDYALFVAGMYPEAVDSWRHRRRHHIPRPFGEVESPSAGELERRHYDRAARRHDRFFGGLQIRRIEHDKRRRFAPRLRRRTLAKAAVDSAALRTEADVVWPPILK